MKIKNATILFVLVPFILGTVMLIYCIWAVSTNKNYIIQETVSVGKAKLVWYTEKVKDSDVPVTRVQCIGSRKSLTRTRNATTSSSQKARQNFHSSCTSVRAEKQTASR